MNWWTRYIIQSTDCDRRFGCWASCLISSHLGRHVTAGEVLTGPLADAMTRFRFPLAFYSHFSSTKTIAQLANFLPIGRVSGRSFFFVSLFFVQTKHLHIFTVRARSFPFGPLHFAKTQTKKKRFKLSCRSCGFHPI